MYSLLKNVALVVLISSSVLFASQITVSADDPNTPYTWNTSDFSGTNPCALDPIITWNLASADGTKGLSFSMTGAIPEADPLFTQTITNNTNQIWKDWHVDIYHGSITSATVYKVGTATNWMQQLHIYNDGYNDGFGAGYGGDPNLAIGLGEKLYVRFLWAAVGSGTQISQYPTYDGNFIPEPCTIAFLTFGLVAFGLKSRKQTS